MRHHLTRRGLAATAIAGGLLGAGIAGASYASGSSHGSTTTHFVTSPAAASPAAASPPPTGTLSKLPYTYPAGTAGELLNPMGISASGGKVYVSNSGENVVSLLTGGNTTTVAGSVEGNGDHGNGGQATSATLAQPTAIAEDAAGNLYIADTEDNVIRKIDAKTGVITRFAGTGTPGAAGLNRPATEAQLDAPQGLAVNAAGDVFIADTYNNRIVEVLPSGRIEPFAGKGVAGYRGDGGKATVAELSHPVGVAVDRAGNVYIADASNNVIRRVDAKSGIITTVAGDYAADRANDGRGGFSGDGGPATSAQLNDPQGVALDSAGDLFIADTSNNAVREVTAAGTIYTVVNSAGANGAAPPAGGETAGPATASRLKDPAAVAVDGSSNTLYIADGSNSGVAAVTGLAQSGSAPGPVASAPASH